jgi:anti-sigma-K factor RskA
MNYSDPNLRDHLASAYALGTLQGRARRRMEKLLAADAAWQSQVAEWQDRLYALEVEPLAPVMPPDHVLQSAKVQLFGQPASQQGRLANRRRRLWIPVAIAAGVIALALFFYPDISLQRAEYVAVLTNQQAQPAMRIAIMAPDRMVVKMQHLQPVGPGRSMQLWLIAGPHQKPESLGLLPVAGSRSIQMPAGKKLQAGFVLAVSLEPAGGSPTGLPTGPVLYQGKLVTAG